MLGSAMSEDRRIYQGHVERNRDVILGVLDEHVPDDGHVLEIASGTGQHAWYYANKRPGWTWQPSEPSAERCFRADAWLEAEPLPNLRPATVVDVTAPWDLERATYDIVFNANMVHISPWATCEGLMRGASEYLADAGKLLMYGPFKVGGEHTAKLNATIRVHGVERPDRDAHPVFHDQLQQIDIRTALA